MHTKEFYDEKRKAFEDATNIEKLKNFLKTVTTSYDELYHFTDFNALKGIIENKKWKFNPLDRMNDKSEPEKETGDWENRISVSFSHGDEDNIGMWKMYGENNVEDPFNPSICISLPKSFLVQWTNTINESEQIQNLLRSFFVYECNGEPIINSDKIKIIASLHDIVYYYGYNGDLKSQLIWENNYKGIAKENLNKIVYGNAPELIGYIKNSAWEYERESRISIVAPQGFKLKTINPDTQQKIEYYIPIDNSSLNLMMKGIKIRLSPFSHINEDCYNCFVRRVEKLFEKNISNESPVGKPRCSKSFFMRKVVGKDSSKASYRKTKDNLSNNIIINDSNN